MKHLLLILVLSTLCSCSQQTNHSVDTDPERQLENSDTDQQQDESVGQIKKSIEQADHSDIPLDKWEQHALREFEIHWPPVDPAARSANLKSPLLRGELALQEVKRVNGDHELQITVRIIRPSTERDKKFWNSQLRFSEVPWMNDVRVWDTEFEWQWPNLPYLLRRHGEERVERYGGVDPGKFVDNDFAAVLIRKYDEDGEIESRETQDMPLVSAEWYGGSEQQPDIHSLVHIAKSDTFRVNVGGDDDHTSGKLRLWLIYADFLNSRPPASWPTEREWAGGILNYCEIDWEKRPNEPCRGTAKFQRPSSATKFDWKNWSEDPSNPAKARLTDRMQ